jgi:hypothetical protein
MVNDNNPDNDKDIARQMLSLWVVKSFAQVTKETVTNTFNKICD